MTETYTTKKTANGVIKKLNRGNCELDFDDQLFYDVLKSKMDTLLRKPQDGSINKIASYSKTWDAPLR